MRRALRLISLLALVATIAATSPVPSGAGASSHREAPLMAGDPYADITDVYAFVSPDQPDTVTLIANWYPFQEPAGGPNFYTFGDDVIHEIHVDNVGDARAHITYQFRFKTQSLAGDTTFLYNNGPIASPTDENLLVRQTYSVTEIRDGKEKVLGEGLAVPPVNIGPKSTPDYDKLAQQALHSLPGGVRAFAGQRDDPFFVDLGAVFDLLSIRPGAPGNMGGGKDGLAGYNVNSIALQIPITRLTRDGTRPADASAANAVIGVWATSSRQTLTLTPGRAPSASEPWVQVSRLGMPLVNEVVVPRAAKDLFNSARPEDDAQFLAGVQDPEPARLLNLLYGLPVPPTPRNDLAQVFLTGVPGLNMPPEVKPAEMIRLNLAIPPSKEPNRLGVLAGDLAGFPNGRRLADDVTDIELRAVAGVLVEGFNTAPGNQLGDGVDANDLPFLSIFPYLATPHQGYANSHSQVTASAAGTAGLAGILERGGSARGTLAGNPNGEGNWYMVNAPGDRAVTITLTFSPGSVPAKTVGIELYRDRLIEKTDEGSSGERSLTVPGGPYLVKITNYRQGGAPISYTLRVSS